MERVRLFLKWDQRSELAKTIFLLVIVVGATLGGYGLFMLAMGTTSPLVVVVSESMVPNLEYGDLLVIQGRTDEQISVGDIVVYQDTEWHTGGPIVHRIVSIDEINGTYYFYTKGDANPTNDPGSRTIDEIVGVMVLRIPYLGYVSLFLRSEIGIVVTVIIFIVILILPEFICKEGQEEEIRKSDDAIEE